MPSTTTRSRRGVRARRRARSASRAFVRPPRAEAATLSGYTAATGAAARGDTTVFASQQPTHAFKILLQGVLEGTDEAVDCRLINVQRDGYAQTGRTLGHCRRTDSPYVEACGLQHICNLKRRFALADYDGQDLGLRCGHVEPFADRLSGIIRE